MKHLKILQNPMKTYENTPPDAPQNTSKTRRNTSKHLKSLQIPSRKTSKHLKSHSQNWMKHLKYYKIQ